MINLWKYLFIIAIIATILHFILGLAGSTIWLYHFIPWGIWTIFCAYKWYKTR